MSYTSTPELNKLSSTEKKAYKSYGLALLIAVYEMELVNKDYDQEQILNLDSIKYCLEALPKDTREKFSDWFIQLSQKEVVQLMDEVIKVQNTDYIFNDIAESFYDADEQKRRGIVLTPKWLANYITNKAITYWNQLNAGKGIPKKVADLSCGAGVFIKELQSSLDTKSNIYGVDISHDYVFFTRLATVSDKITKNIIIHCLDTLTDLRVKEQIELFQEEEIIPVNNYDIIVGNPPYVRSQQLDSGYSKIIKDYYTEFVDGNFDLTVPFLAHTFKALSDGGIGALVVSSKFMSSKYGKKICSVLAKQTRILEITDFGDGQVFPKKTTYTCVIIFAKLPPNGDISIYKFPPGLKWDNKESYLKDASMSVIPQKQLEEHPWNLTSGFHEEILKKFIDSSNPKLTDVFPRIIQGVRTGANNIFVVNSKDNDLLESETMYPYIDGTNIRRVNIKKTDKKMVWPYKLNQDESVTPLTETELKEKFYNTWKYLNNYKTVLSDRKLENGAPWFSYSRTQNLLLPKLRKILVREMMPSAQFAADSQGEFIFSSGYGLVGSDDMPNEEYHMWAAILSTPTMEFQLRFNSTQLHSGWFRILKQHLQRIRLINLSKKQKKEAIEISKRLINDSNNEKLWDKLDLIVAQAFNLTESMRDEIKSFLESIHAVSKPNYEINIKENKQLQNDKIEDYSNSEIQDNILDTVYPDLTNEQRLKYMPIEVTMYNKYHRDRPELAQLVTFKKNKENTPIHSWYKYTQGYSRDLVQLLLKELDVKSGEKVYDPFMGSGTTLLTCKEEGIRSYGADISPLMTWITKLKVEDWNTTKLNKILKTMDKANPTPCKEENLLFMNYLEKAFAPEILSQIIGWRNWINNQELEKKYKDFLLLGLISILEEISFIRKHGSHYRYLNNTESVGLKKLNINVIDSAANIKEIFINKISKMVQDVSIANLKKTECNVYTLNSRSEVPSENADIIITSPPYLNRNNYFSQQKAELSLLGLISSNEEYKNLVKTSYRSHVEAELEKEPISKIPEVNKIISSVVLTENNNPKIPHMIAGYFDDLQQTLSKLKQNLNPGARLAFVVGNSRWGGVVVPVDHLLALIAERLGYKLDRILVARYKGNSPQQMKRYGQIKVRESIVLLKWEG